MKKSLLTLLTLCLAVMLALSSCTIPLLNIETDDLLAMVGIGSEKQPDPVDETPKDEEPEELPEEIGDPIDIPSARGKSDSNSFVFQFPLYTFPGDGIIKAVQVEMNKTLTMRIYAAPDTPVAGKPSVVTFAYNNETSVGYSTKNDTCAELGDGVYCYEYLNVPFSILGKDATIVINLANTIEAARKGNLCCSLNYSFYEYFEYFLSQPDADQAQAVSLLMNYAKALNAYSSALTVVKKQNKRIAEAYYKAYDEYQRNLALYKKGKLAEKPTEPEMPPVPTLYPSESANVDLDAAVVEGFTTPEGVKEFEITPSFRNVKKLKNYIAGVYVDFSGSAPVLVFRLCLDDAENVDVRLNDYRISSFVLKKNKEAAASSVDGKTVLYAKIKDLLPENEVEEKLYYLVKSDALTITSLAKSYTLTIYDEENNTIESLTYSALDYIRAFADGRDVSAEDLAKLAVDVTEIKKSEETGTSGGVDDLYEYVDKLDADGNPVYELDKDGNVVTDDQGNPKVVKEKKLKEQYEVQTEIVTYNYPTEANALIGDVLIAWYNLSQSEYLTK